jgi:hypothetical protein
MRTSPSRVCFRPSPCSSEPSNPRVQRTRVARCARPGSPLTRRPLGGRGSSLAALLGVICLFVVSARLMATEQGASVPQLPVRVSVTAEAPLRDDFQKCLKDQLAGIRDVRLSDDEASLTLDIIITEFRMSDGLLAGYMLYAGGYHPGPRCPGTSKVVGSQPVAIIWQELKMYPPDLDAVCRRTVEQFKQEIVDVTVREMQRHEVRP